MTETKKGKGKLTVDKFSKETKLEVVAYAKNHTVEETALKFGISETKINRWMT